MNASLMLGQAASLGAALCWAVAVTMFRQPIAAYGARAVNLAKNTLATVLLGITVVVLGQGADLVHAPAAALAWVAASGVVGLTVGDTALFAAVGRLGVHRALLLQSLGPVFTAGMAWVMLGEVITLRQGGAGLVILAGVSLVVAPGYRVDEHRAEKHRVDEHRAEKHRAEAYRDGRSLDALGLGLGILAAFGQGAGVVLAKSGMQDMPVIAASFVRMVCGAAGLMVMLALARRLPTVLATLASRTALRRVVPASILGTYVAFVLMMAGIAWAPAAVAAVLLGTTPVFGLFLDAKVERRPVTARALVGTVLTVMGVALLATNG